MAGAGRRGDAKKPPSGGSGGQGRDAPEVGARVRSGKVVVAGFQSKNPWKGYFTDCREGSACSEVEKVGWGGGVNGWRGRVRDGVEGQGPESAAPATEGSGTHGEGGGGGGAHGAHYADTAEREGRARLAFQ